MMAEIAIIVIHNPPHLNFNFSINIVNVEAPYSLNFVISCLSMLKVLLLVHIYFRHSNWNFETNASAIEFFREFKEQKDKRKKPLRSALTQQKKNNVLINGFYFAMKATLKENAKVIVPIFSLFSILISSFLLRAAEMPVDEAKTSDKKYWKYYWNAFWCTYISMTTVGYGDIYPESTMGKAICVFMCFWGNFLISLIIVTLTKMSKFKPLEERAYYHLD
jgi:hypothetical protein